MFQAWLYRGKTGIVSTIALMVLLGAAGARADVIDVTVMNATYQATCVGGGTCTETINGSTLLNSNTFTASDTAFNLTGSLNAALDGFGTPPFCDQGSCTEPPLFYDLNAHSGLSPIEWNPTLGAIPALTPTAFGPGSSLTVPVGCGGDQPHCGAPGTFQPSASTTYQLVSGTYTAVDETLNLQGGSPSTPVFLLSSTPVAEVTGTIMGGQEDYYSFDWGGGAFSATTTITDGTGTDSFLFSAGVTGTCSTLGSDPLNSGNGFSGTISQANLAAGTYCIGLDDLSGGDPTFALDFSTPVTTPEPSVFVLFFIGLGLAGVLRYGSKPGRFRA